MTPAPQHAAKPSQTRQTSKMILTSAPGQGASLATQSWRGSQC